MKNINFDEGYQEFSINGDANRIIRFNPADTAILTRFKTMYDTIMSKHAEFDMMVQDIANAKARGELDGAEENIKCIEILASLDALICEQVDCVFGSGTAKAAFDGQSPVSPVGGEPLFKRFFDALQPIMSSAIKKQATESKIRKQKYTDAAKLVK